METKVSKNRAYDRNCELLLRYREGDERAGEEFVRLNEPLIYSIASRFSSRVKDMSDLYECGQIGLVKAMRTFDFSRECAFSTYAVPLIFGEMRRFLRDDGIIKISRDEKKLSAIICRERERRLATGEDVGIAAIAKAVGVSAAEAASALFAANPVRSLEENVFGDEEGVTLGAVIADEDEEAKSFDKLALGMALEKLTKEQRKLIILRYFRDMSQSRVAEIMGMTQVKVSRQEKRIMQILRNELS
ncbi:MAG: sigma-70 family RNA polymerase sigma factor [Clostridia bacterium]|nr:sigma-70 family RNA polymerase sigma factor [Clostridia bacterium]